MPDIEEHQVLCAVCHTTRPTGSNGWLALAQSTGQQLVDVGAVCSWRCVHRLAERQQAVRMED